MYSEEEMILRLLGADNAQTPSDGSENSPKTSWGLVNYPLASVYAPLQEWQELLDMDEALARGTLFAQLEKPFLGARR